MQPLAGGTDPGETSKAEDNDKERGPILGGKRRRIKVAAEFGLDPNDNFVWYRIVKLSPDRFEEIVGAGVKTNSKSRDRL